MNACRSQDSVSIRLAAPSDVDAVLALCRELYEFDGTPFHADGHRAALVELISRPDCGCVWLIEVGAETIGYVVLCFGFSLEFRGRDAFVDEFYLREPFRRRGVGTEVMEQVAREAQRLGVKALHLEVERTNTAAQAFYRKIGFKDHSRYLMTKWLQQGLANGYNTTYSQ